MNTLNPRVTELTERLERGETVAAITAEFTAKWCVSDRTVRAYLAVARKQLDERNQIKQSIIDEVRTEAIAEAAKKNVLSDLEVEAVLCSIIKGDYVIEEQRIIDGKPVTIHHKPSHYDVVMAADRLFKKRGSYPSEKQKPQNQTLVLQYNLQKPEDVKYIEGV